MSPLTNYWQVQLTFRVYLSRRSSIILSIKAVSWLSLCYFCSVPDLQDSVLQTEHRTVFLRAKHVLFYNYANLFYIL
jgi:hypothetical protein